MKTKQIAGILLCLALVGANRLEGKRIEGFTEPAQTIDVAAAETASCKRCVSSLARR